jgi:hypothetical protein
MKQRVSVPTALEAVKESPIPVILSADFMILRLATVHENAREVGARASCSQRQPGAMSRHGGQDARAPISMAAKNVQWLVFKIINADASRSLP